MLNYKSAKTYSGDNIKVFRKYLTFIPSSLVVAYLLSGTRWISYIKIGPIFFTDALVVIALIFTSLRILRATNKNTSLLALSAAWSIVLFAVWVVLRFLFNLNFSFETLRDLAPYLYALIGISAAIDFVFSSSQTKKNTIGLLYIALFVHVLWVELSMLNLLRLVNTGFVDISKKIHFFDIRPDIDVSLIGLFLTITVVGAIKLRLKLYLKFFVSIILFIASYTVCLFDTRSGFVTVFITLTLGIISSGLISKKKAPSKAKIVTLATYLLVISLGIAFALPKLTVIDRISGAITTITKVSDGSLDSVSELPQKTSIQKPTTTVSSYQNDGLPNNGQGTTEARIAAWGNLAKWNISNPERLAIGVGFGTNFMLESGTTIKLLGKVNSETTQVRSPHNFLLGTFARLGIVGLVLLLLVLVITLKQFIYLNKQKELNQLVFLGFLIFISVTAPSLLGVVFEAPFGAIPFWWGIGLIAGAYASEKLKLIGISPGNKVNGQQRIEGK